MDVQSNERRSAYDVQCLSVLADGAMVNRVGGERMKWRFELSDDPEIIWLESTVKPFILINDEFHWTTVDALMHDLTIELGVEE